MATQQNTSIHFPGKSIAEVAQEALDLIKSAVPYNTTFLFMEPGCGSVGQGTPLALAIEAAMKRKFELWAATWHTPYLQDIAEKSK